MNSVWAEIVPLKVSQTRAHEPLHILYTPQNSFLGEGPKSAAAHSIALLELSNPIQEEPSQACLDAWGSKELQIVPKRWPTLSGFWVLHNGLTV